MCQNPSSEEKDAAACLAGLLTDVAQVSPNKDYAFVNTTKLTDLIRDKWDRLSILAHAVHEQEMKKQEEESIKSAAIDRAIMWVVNASESSLKKLLQNSKEGSEATKSILLLADEIRKRQNADNKETCNRKSRPSLNPNRLWNE